jgi:hypothetical protein
MTSVDELIKKAELEKLISERLKTDAEREKISFEHDIVKKEEEKKWWTKSKFRQQIVAVLLGLSVLGFYITYIVIPSFSINNIKLELDNQKKEKVLYEKSIRLAVDSATLKQLLGENDSIYNKLISDEHKIVLLERGRNRIDSIYNELLAASKIDKAKLLQLNELKNSYNREKERILSNVKDDLSLKAEAVFYSPSINTPELQF